MIIVPFIHKVKQIAGMQLSIFQLLTIGGTLPWEEEDTLKLEEDILHPNGIYLASKPIKQNDLYLCPVDPVKTNLSDFYQWKEVETNDVETFCWRTIYVTGEPHNYRGWLPIPANERFGSQSIQEVLDRIHAEVI